MTFVNKLKYNKNQKESIKKLLRKSIKKEKSRNWVSRPLSMLGMVTIYVPHTAKGRFLKKTYFISR